VRQPRQHARICIVFNFLGHLVISLFGRGHFFGFGTQNSQVDRRYSGLRYQFGSFCLYLISIDDGVCDRWQFSYSTVGRGSGFTPVGVVEKFLADIVDGESDFDFVGSDCGVPAAIFAEKPGLDVAEVFCAVRCGNFNLSDDREVTKRLRCR
jgi:hypothetical protein